MAIGVVTKYNGLETTLFGTAGRQWDDATAGSNMFILADNTYIPSATHSTTSQLLGVITTGAGAPIAVPAPVLDSASVVGTTSFASGAANFGANVTITAKFLICVQPVTANTFLGTTDKLLWYVDLDTTNTTTSQSSTNSNFIINQPANGWYSIT